jgi:ribonuclease HI
VAQAIPAYCMSSILLPESLGEELERMMNSFWWGSNKASGKGINWLRWEKLAMRKEHGGMGFRHLYGFNLAMLGKQGWHLLTNQDTILSKVFKAKYYPKEGFLDAKLGHNPSYVWRSIQASQVVVRSGLRWRVGNGANIDVWRQPWLRNSDSSCVTTVMSENNAHLKVADLIDNATGSWNFNYIQQNFCPRDVLEIMKIPLNLLQNEDAPIWKCSRNGSYNVRSAYYNLMENVIDNNHLKVEGNWKKLWKLKVPNKVKIFLWRVLRGCLPVRARLSSKGVQCDTKCPCCGEYEENEWHCFVGCMTAQEVWMGTECWQEVEKYSTNAMSFVSMILNMLEELDNKNMTVVAMMMWSLWWRRNQKCWNDNLPTVHATIRRTRENLYDWKQAQRCGTAAVHTNADPELLSWRKPPVGSLKCNIDAAVYIEQNIFCIGACLRDEQGQFMKAFAKRFEGQPNISEAEAIGLLEALKWLNTMHTNHVYLETDSMQVVNYLNNKCHDSTEFGIIIETCRNLLLYFEHCKVSYVRRQANRVAHDLAQAARFNASRQVFNYCPPCIEATIMNEMH